MTTALAHYGRILRAGWRWVLWGVLIALLVATTVLVVRPPLFRSEAVVFIRTPGDTSRVLDGGAMYGALRAETFAILATRSELSARVIADLGLKMTPEELSSRIHAKPRGGTSLIYLTVDASSPSDAQRIAGVVLTEWQASVRDLEAVPGSLVPRAELSVVDSPSRDVDLVVWGVPLTRALLGVALFGAVFGALGVVLRSMFGESGRHRRITGQRNEDRG